MTELAFRRLDEVIYIVSLELKLTGIRVIQVIYSIHIKLHL